MFYTEMCFTSEAECSHHQLYMQMQANQVCQKAKTCADCLRAHKLCGWVDDYAIKWPQPSCILTPLWPWSYGPDWTDKLSDCPSTTTMATTRPACYKCGTFKAGGTPSCCAPGGSWFTKCGTAQPFVLSWDDGIEACEGQLQACLDFLQLGRWQDVYHLLIRLLVYEYATSMTIY